MDIVKVRRYISIYSDYIDDTNLDFFIEDATASTNADIFGADLEKAIALKAMHSLYMSKLSIDKEGETVSAVIQKTIGPVTVQYSAADSNKIRRIDGTYNLSLYGKMYLDLMNSHVVGMSVNSFRGPK